MDTTLFGLVAQMKGKACKLADEIPAHTNDAQSLSNAFLCGQLNCQTFCKYTFFLILVVQYSKKKYTLSLGFRKMCLLSKKSRLKGDTDASSASEVCVNHTGLISTGSEFTV